MNILMYLDGCNQKWQNTHILSLYTHTSKVMCQVHFCIWKSRPPVHII